MTERTGLRTTAVRFPLVQLCAFGPASYAAMLFALAFWLKTRAIDPYLPALVALLAVLALIGLLGSITGRLRYGLRAVGTLLNGLILAALAFAALGM